MPSSVSLVLLCRQPEGEIVICNTRYGRSGMRASLRIATNKGYYRRVRQSNAYIRTAKAMVPGDSLKKPIRYSFPDEEGTTTGEMPGLRQERQGQVLAQDARLQTDQDPRP